MKIYKNKVFSLLFFTLLFIILSSSAVFSAVKGNIKYNSVIFDYSRLNEKEIRTDADKYFNLYTQTQKEQYIYIALNKYYLLTKIHPEEVNNYVQLGRIYDNIKKPRLAKEYFSKAINIAPYNPYASFYFGEFYYKKRDYKKALAYYNNAYNHGYNNMYELNLRLATIYEKFADLVNAKKFYEVSYSLKSDKQIQKKIQLLNELNYDKSEYYHFIRE